MQKQVSVLIIILLLVCKQVCWAQNFTIYTNCGFEASLPKSFTKSKDKPYYSNTNCFDTILTNKKGCYIYIFGIDYPREKSDTFEIKAIELLNDFKRNTKNLNLMESKMIVVNNIDIGLVTYKYKGDKKKIYQDIFFVTKGKIRCYFKFIMNKDQFDKGINMDIIKTIRVMP